MQMYENKGVGVKGSLRRDEIEYSAVEAEKALDPPQTLLDRYVALQRPSHSFAPLGCVSSSGKEPLTYAAFDVTAQPPGALVRALGSYARPFVEGLGASVEIEIWTPGAFQASWHAQQEWGRHITLAHIRRGFPGGIYYPGREARRPCVVLVRGPSLQANLYAFLHELGHHATWDRVAYRPGESAETRLLREEHAWNWADPLWLAITHRRCFPPRIRRQRRYALNTYRRNLVPAALRG